MTFIKNSILIIYSFKLEDGSTLYQCCFFQFPVKVCLYMLSSQKQQFVLQLKACYCIRLASYKAYILRYENYWGGSSPPSPPPVQTGMHSYNIKNNIPINFLTIILMLQYYNPNYLLMVYQNRGLLSSKGLKHRFF